MTRVGLRGITTRRLRTALTALAIVLGVAMVSGSYTLTDTMRGAADSLSSSAYDGTAAVVSAKTAFKVDVDNPVRPTIPADTLEQVRAVPGVEKAVGSISDEARIVGRDGDIVGTGPYFGVGLDPQAGKLSPFKLKTGQFATGPGQVVIDAGTADREHYSVGDKIAIQARGPERKLRVTGIATFGDVDSIGTATFALFDLHAAQPLFDKPRRLHRDPRRRAGLGPQAALAVARRLGPGPDRGGERSLHPGRAEDVREVPEDPPARVRRNRRRSWARSRSTTRSRSRSLSARVSSR